MTTIPTLETERLVLRGARADDLNDSLALWSDLQVVRYISTQPATREEVWARLLRYVGHWAINGYGFWEVHDRATGRFVGEVGMADFKRDLQPELARAFEGVAEAGWVLAPWAHGQGLATEAMTAVLAWADGASHHRTVCIIDPGNWASLRVAAKCGYSEIARGSYKGVSIVALERIAPSGAPSNPR